MEYGVVVAVIFVIAIGIYERRDKIPVCDIEQSGIVTEMI